MVGMDREIADVAPGPRLGRLSHASLSEVDRHGTMANMTAKEMLTDEELGALASEWRKKALQGELHARGIAHEFETEMRRRVGAPPTNYDTLDLRPLDQRPLELRAAVQRRWWRFWRVN